MQHTSIPFWTVWFIYLHVLWHNPPLHRALSSQCDRTVYSSCRVLIDWLKSLSLKTVCWLAVFDSVWQQWRPLYQPVTALHHQAGTTPSTPSLCSFPPTASLHMQKHTKAHRDLKWPFKETQLSFLHHCTIKTAATASVWQGGWDGMCNSIWMAVTHCSSKESWEYATSTTVHIQWKIRKWSYWRLCGVWTAVAMIMCMFHK